MLFIVNPHPNPKDGPHGARHMTRENQLLHHELRAVANDIWDGMMVESCLNSHE